MRLLVIAVGQHIPPWAQTAVETYAKRFPSELRLDIKTVRTEPRGTKNGPPPATLLAAERARIQGILDKAGRGVHTVALDEHGQSVTTQALAQRLQHWQMHASTVALLIGGPDGLDAHLKHSAHECIRLSDLTLPHALARVLLLEQLYRAWTIAAGHPYHRE